MVRRFFLWSSLNPSWGRGALEKGQLEGTHHNEAHLAHGLLVVVVHLADQGVAQVHGDALDRLVLPRGVEDAEQELVDSAVLELQLLGNAEVTEGQTAVPLDLGGMGDKGNTVRVGLGSWTKRCEIIWSCGVAFWKRRLQGFFLTLKLKKSEI